MKPHITAKATILIFALTGCVISENNPENPRVIESEVASYTGPAGTLEAELDNSEEITLGAGRISSGGGFSFELDETLETGLDPVDFLRDSCANVEISDETAKLAVVARIFVLENGAPAGYLVKTDGADLNSDAYVAELRLYADKPVNVKGACEAAPATDTDLTLKRGWNVVRVSFSGDAEGEGAFSYRSGVSPFPELAWTYIDESQSGDAGFVATP